MRAIADHRIAHGRPAPARVRDAHARRARMRRGYVEWVPPRVARRYRAMEPFDSGWSGW